MKVGIIGSGIGGLAAAYFLNQQGQQVTLLEKLPDIGMDAHRISLDLEGQQIEGDVPSRMFNELQWPELCSLYKEIGVESVPVDPTQSFSRVDQSVYLKLDIANRPRLALNMLKDRRLRAIATDIERLQKQGTGDLMNDHLRELSLGEYLRNNNYSFEFVQEFLYPTLSSTVFTCSYQALDNYPSAIALATLKRLFDSPKLLRTKFGTSDVVQRLTKGIKEIRTSTKVESFTEQGEEVFVRHSYGTERFDHLIVATQANHIEGMYDAISEVERLTLQGFQNENVDVIVHTDRALLPKAKKHWSTFNMILAKPDEPAAAMCSVWMNRFHDGWNLQSPVFQTINPLVQPQKESVLARISLQRPVVSQHTYQLWEQLAQIQNAPGRRIWFAGSYASEGLPLLETGVRSAKQIALRIGKPSLTQLEQLD